MKKRELILNVDGDCLWYIKNIHHDDYSDFDSKARAYVREYAGSGITRLVYSVSGMCSSTPSKVLTYYGDKLGWTEENGIPVDYTKHDRIVPYARVVEGGLDPYAVLFGETRACGISPWLSVRMNDIHDNEAPTSFLRGELFYRALNGKMTENYDYIPEYYRKCVNYSFASIRKTMLDYITEQVERYDVDGVELDFLREIYCFDYLHDENAKATLTGFLRDVRRALDDREKTVGHKIALGARVCRGIEENEVFGLDVRTWVEEGLVDCLVPMSRWGTSDSDVPLDKWLALAEGSKTAIYAGIENFSDFANAGKTYGVWSFPTTVEIAKAHAAKAYDAGCPGFYLFNFYQCYIPAEHDGIPGFRYDFCRPIWEATATPEAAEKGVRRFLVTYQDLCPANMTPYRPLPMPLDGGGEVTVKTAKVKASDRVTLYVGYRGTLPAVTVNGKVLAPAPHDGGTYFEETVASPDFPKGQDTKGYAAFTAFDLPAAPGTDTFRISFEKSKGTIANYLEIKFEN